MLLDHILIPIDGSETIDELLDWTRLLMRSEGQISLVRVINMPKYKGFRAVLVTDNEIGMHRNIQEEVRDAMIELEQFAKAIKTNGIRNINVHVKAGEPAQSIVDVAKEVGADLIIMPTYNRSSFHRWLLESTAITVLHKAPCPTLIIRRDGICLQINKSLLIETAEYFIS